MRQRDERVRYGVCRSLYVIKNGNNGSCSCYGSAGLAPHHGESWFTSGPDL